MGREPTEAAACGVEAASMPAHRAPAPPVAGAPCRLAEPGILVAMIAPDQTAPVPTAPAGGGSAAVGPVLLAATVAFGAIVLVHAAGELQHRVRPFGAAGLWVWAAVAGLGLAASGLVTALARSRPVAPVHGMVGLAGALALALAGAVAAVGGSPLALWSIAAMALGATLAIAVGGARRTGQDLGLVLGCAAGVLVCVFGELPASLAHGPVVASLAAAAALLLVGFVPADPVAPASMRPSPLRTPLVVAAFALLGWSLWRTGEWAPACSLGMWSLAMFPVVAVVRGMPRQACVAAALLWAGSHFAPNAPVDAGHELVVARNGPAAVHYLRRSQELQLVAHGECVDATGPLRDEAPLVAVLVQALANPGDRVTLLGVGTGQVARDLHRLQRHVVEIVDGHACADSLRHRFAAVGPVAARDADVVPLPRRRSGIAEAARALPVASRQCLVLPVPVRDGDEALAVDVQRELRAVGGPGFVLQAIALDRVAPATLHQLFGAAAAAHAWNGLFVVGNAAVLCSAAAPIRWQQLPSFAQWSDDARWLAHRAHLGSLADVQHAMLGTLHEVAPPFAASPSAPGRAAALAVVHAWVRAAAPATESTSMGAGLAADSLLARWSALQAELRSAAARLRTLADDAEGRATAADLAARFLHIGAPLPELQAALGLPGRDGVALRQPAAASRNAFALDPTFFHHVPEVCRTLRVPLQPAGDLEDLAMLPVGAQLLAACTEDSPLAIALRARFPTACARALVAALAQAPLEPAAQQALRELADPFVLQEASIAVAGRHGEKELLAIWRGDLAMPPTLALLLRRAVEDRRLLARALGSRRDARSHDTLATLLEDEAVLVRAVAGESLRQVVGERIPFDPEWPQSRRHEAAERLRALHNRAP